jgi:NitT/TauT family transport system ATP-binding protein
MFRSTSSTRKRRSTVPSSHPDTQGPPLPCKGSGPVACDAPMSPPPSVIRFSNVDQVFQREDGASVTALSGLSFDVGKHEFVAVLGPSGCGKSTLLRLIAGLVFPTSGDVSIYGQTVTEPRDEIGMVFQKPTLLPWFDVLGNVTFPLRHKYGRVNPADKDRARELLKLVDLESFAKAQIDQLSGGMQQRVAIARALLLDPDILLMDEPFSALDALTRDEMSFELLRIWAERPKTVMFITHSIPEAVLLADRIIVMTPRPGKVAEILDVKLPRPRSFDSLADPRFQEMANHIRSKLFTRHAAE